MYPFWCKIQVESEFRHPRRLPEAHSGESGRLLSDLVHLGARRSRRSQAELSEPSDGLLIRRASFRPAELA